MGRYFYLALLAFVQSAYGDVEPFINDARFDAGDYGVYPLKAYHSSSVISPRLNILSMNESCRNGQYTMLNPRGNLVPKENARGPVILDDAGDLVWTKTTGWGGDRGDTYGLTVQTYKEKPYLTFWAGDDSVRGHGEGVYYMLDQNYNVAYQLDGIGGLKGDLHELKITPEGTALMTIYKVSKVSGDSDHKYFEGYIWDSIIQELDIETNKLVFEWRASDHYSLWDSYNSENTHGSPDAPYDFFHLNSIEKDPLGNYMVSSRYMHTLTYIEGSTGNILWVLGGKNNAFKDLSNGKATNFAWQHHARWHNNYTEISLFDNGADYQHTTGSESRGMLLAVDTEAMTVSLLKEYLSPEKILSSSQGSMQMLPNGNVLLGYGYNGAWTEYSADGTALCATHFGASSHFNTGDVQSYRVLKHSWVGLPLTKPDLAVVNGIAYVSWNGATEVVRWMVQGSMDTKAGAEFYAIKSVEKMGFETGISLEGIEGTIRLTALDSSGDVLGITHPVTVGIAKEMSHAHGDVTDKDLLPLQLMVAFMSLVMIGLGLREFAGCWIRRRAVQLNRLEDRDDEELLIPRRNPQIEITQVD